MMIMMNDNELFRNLGFSWDRQAIPKPDKSTPDKAILQFKRNLPKFVWETGVLENNPFSYVEVQTFLDGITVGGHKISDEDQIRGIAESAKLLIQMLRTHTFDERNIDVMRQLHAVLAKNEALDAGLLRGEGDAKGTPKVFLGELGEYLPPNKTTDGKNIANSYNSAAKTIEAIGNPLEKGIALFLFIAKEQPFFDGNKRIGRLMMNGILMSNGVSTISIPAKQHQKFNETMINFYKSCADNEIGNAGTGMEFMANIYTSEIEYGR